MKRTGAVRRARWEHEKLIKLIAEGKCNREIAGIIGRSQCAVGARAQEHKLRTAPVEPPKKGIPITELISEEEIPDWYVLGWRIIGFYGTRIQIEWVSSKPQRRPVTMKMLEAA